MKVFISWGGQTALQLAIAFKECVLNDFLNEEDIFVSSNIQVGELWFNEITKGLDGVEEGLVILTQSSYARQWVNFESGFIFGKLKKLSLMLFTHDSDLKDLGPFDQFQKFNGKSKEDVLKYLSKFNPNRARNERWANAHFNEWVNRVDEILFSERPLESNISKFYNLFKIDTNKVLNNNVYSSIINKFLSQTAVATSEIETKFEIQAENYPHYVLDLQKELKVQTKAIALHNHFENFWGTLLGHKITDTISEDSQRIFVYNTQQDLENDFLLLMSHSKVYTVYILSFEVLSARYPAYAKDFSIISAGVHKVHAEYNLSSPLKTINFTANSHKTSTYEKIFDEIASKSIPFEKKYRLEDLDEVKRLVFNYPDQNLEYKLSNYEKKSIEMSKYIPIHDYEQHEEEHAYYIEMLDNMLAKIDKTKPLRILELGAGTGNLTKRLVLLPKAQIVAIEYDWACFKRLQHNFHDYSKDVLELRHEDSRIYNPPGEFDIIISSFSDHHIKPEDKFSYFKNVIRNLNPEGLFIVGDEFLRDYDPDDRIDYIKSLEVYHNHIIGIAEQKGQKILASLEREALISGIDGIGDFKVSNKIYESYLEEVKFPYTKELIGPKDVPGIGGIFVYTMTMPQ